MLRLIYLCRNLTRNPLRTMLTCAAVALPITIYMLSMAVVDGVDRFLDNSAKQLRLAVNQKSSIVNPLPMGHRRKIESLDPTRTRMLSICGMDWIGGKVERDPRPLSTLAADADTFLATFPEYNLTQEEIDGWYRDRQAIIVGATTARQFNWKVGDRITITPSLPPYSPLEFHVISTAEKAKDPLTLWIRLDYYQEAVKKAGGNADHVGFFFIKCASNADLDYFRVAIDQLFANTPDETKTQDEKAFMNEFITQQFNLPRNLTILAAVTVFVAVMAATNTMSMNFRDRMNEIATLKSMGFGGGFTFGLIQSESMLLCALGGVIGALGPYIVFTYTPMRDYTVPLILHLEVNPIVCVYAILIAMGIGLIAAVWPSWLAMRMKVVNALRNLE
jgi:putative ABC transport system permease protein